jgi:hypothetical protein
LHQKLTDNNGHQADPLVDAYRHINGAYRMVFKLISFFYSANIINFAQMGEAQDLIHNQHQNAMAVGHFLLAGDFFDRYEHYGKVVDLLQDDRMYSRYKRLVTETRENSTPSCGVDTATAFHQLLKPVN